MLLPGRGRPPDTLDPDPLATRVVGLASPCIGERGDEGQTAPGLVIPALPGFGQAVTPGVRGPDPQGAGREGQGEAGVAAPDAAVQGGVRGMRRAGCSASGSERIARPATPS
jgi:hypothetical protein